MEALVIARGILAGRNDGLRYKILTLGQIRKWKAWHDPGKENGEPWNNGEWMIAFEDGCVNFREGGGAFRGPLKRVEEIAAWIEFLNGHHFNRWHEYDRPRVRVH